MNAAFEIDTLSHLMHVTEDISYLDLQNTLLNEGFEWPYLPLGYKNKSVLSLIHDQSPNFHYFSDGQLADTVSSFTFEYDKKRAFELKDAPRAACGPDYKTLLTGTQTPMGQIKAVTLKLNSLPSNYLACVISKCDSTDAMHIIRKCVLNHYHPYGVVYEDNQAPLWKAFKIKNRTDSKDLLLLWSGPSYVYKATSSFVESLCKSMALSPKFTELVSLIEPRIELLKHKPKADWKNLYIKSVWQAPIKVSDDKIRNELMKKLEGI